MEQSRKHPWVRLANLNAAMVVGVFIAAISLAEEVVSLAGPVAGVLFHGAILLSLLATYFFLPYFPYRWALLSLLLLPLLRILSLTIPIPELPRIYWFAAIGAPLLYSALLVYRYVRITLENLRMEWIRPDWRKLPLQAAFGLLGLPLGWAAYAFLHPRPLIAPQSGLALVAGELILIVFSGYLEELIFRGLILPLLIGVFGRVGLLVSVALYAVMYLSTYSIQFVLLAAAMGLLFSLWTARTGSIWGAVIAHSFLSVGLLLIWPLVH